MTTVEPAARAATVTVACAGLPAAMPLRPAVSQPWSTALVTRWRSESATRVEHPGVQLDVLAGEDQRRRPWPSGGRRRRARGPAAGSRRRPGAAAPSPGPSRRRGRRRAGSARPRPRAQQLAGGGAELVAEGDEGVQARPAAACGRSTRRPAPRAARGRTRAARRPARRARGRAGRSGGRRARPRRRRRAGRAPGGWGPGSSRRTAAGRGRRRRSVLRRRLQPRHGDRVVAGAGALSAATTAASSSGADRPGRAGQRPADALGGDEQHVDEVLADRRAGRREGAEQVLGAVGDVDDAVQAEHPGRALDGVGVAEQPAHQLARRRVRLQPQQALAQRRQPLLDLGAEGGDQLRVVGPAHGSARPGTARSRSAARRRAR